LGLSILVGVAGGAAIGYLVPARNVADGVRWWLVALVLLLMAGALGLRLVAGGGAEEIIANNLRTFSGATVVSAIVTGIASFGITTTTNEKDDEAARSQNQESLKQSQKEERQS
jgi:hypothetical protein